MLIYQPILMLEYNGQIVNQSLKLEINQTVVHVGLSELLKLWVIESVLLQDKKLKQKFHLKIYYHVVDSYADKDVMEDILLLLGDIMLTQDLLLETYINNQDIVNHMLSHHVTITLMEHLHHAQISHNILHQLVKNHAFQDILHHILMINTLDQTHTLLQELIILNKKSSLTDQLKDLSQSMKTS